MLKALHVTHTIISAMMIGMTELIIDRAQETRAEKPEVIFEHEERPEEGAFVRANAVKGAMQIKINVETNIFFIFMIL